MISITRLPEPARLTKNKEKWRAAFLEKRKNKPGSRPNSRQYGHPEIRKALRAMSFHKCFYCERKLVGKGEVDHYIEIAKDPTLAFEWSNLYLSCPECNDKLPSIPVSDCLDPCNSENPAEHLTFDREVIRPKANSSKGSKTVQKYQLDRENLNYIRSRQLHKFRDALAALREHQIRDGGRPPTQSEKEVLTSFAQPDHAFSLMFSTYLAKLDL